MAKAVVLTLLVVSCAAAAAPDAWADPAAGQQVFASECAACHSADKAVQTAGPSLIGVVGRKSAALDEYDYSVAMLGADKTWDPATLDVYLTNPQAAVPGAKMTYPGLASAGDRKNLIDYLATLR